MAKDRNQVDLQEFAKKFIEEKKVEPVYVNRPRQRSASCQKIMRKATSTNSDSVILAPQDDVELHAQKFAEMYRLAVIE